MSGLAPTLICALAVALPNPHNDLVIAEPAGYWTGPVNSPVPASLTGGTVIGSARELVTLIRTRSPILIDVSDPPAKSARHRAIPGSLWIPGVGIGEISLAADDSFRQRLATATNNHLGRALVFYCHENCWLGWNAAKRAISYGYRKVDWYRDGIEGWKAAGYPTAVIEPQVTP